MTPHSFPDVETYKLFFFSVPRQSPTARMLPPMRPLLSSSRPKSTASVNSIQSNQPSASTVIAARTPTPPPTTPHQPSPQTPTPTTPHQASPPSPQSPPPSAARPSAPSPSASHQTAPAFTAPTSSLTGEFANASLRLNYFPSLSLFGT